jgi:hypothetical protein
MWGLFLCVLKKEATNTFPPCIFTMSSDSSRLMVVRTPVNTKLSPPNGPSSSSLKEAEGLGGLETLAAAFGGEEEEEEEDGVEAADGMMEGFMILD